MLMNYGRFLVLCVLLVVMLGCETTSPTAGDRRRGCGHPACGPAGPRVGRSQATNTWEWMIGRWDWTAKSRQGIEATPPELLALERISVFPFMDLGRLIGTNGLQVPMEFQTMDPSGKRQLLWRSDTTWVFPTNITTGGPMGWEFEYKHGLEAGSEWLVLIYCPRPEASFTIRFVKSDPDPGKALGPALVGAGADSEWWEEEYRIRQGLKKKE
jgi:hypothetical protein